MLPESAGAQTSSLYLRVQLTVMIQTSRKGRVKMRIKGILDTLMITGGKIL